MVVLAGAKCIAVSRQVGKYRSNFGASWVSREAASEIFFGSVLIVGRKMDPSAEEEPVNSVSTIKCIATNRYRCCVLTGAEQLVRRFPSRLIAHSHV